MLNERCGEKEALVMQQRMVTKRFIKLAQQGFVYHSHTMVNLDNVSAYHYEFSSRKKNISLFKNEHIIINL